ncbi:hypothetical protein BJAS_P3403 [Bathymodiolus japonicus methanotrophic gill symbiont]|uniref:hypothetical protein n=1 Tax=Bathymodiolus japonicus methanotrophic gill symbiont TaxID=113269 RepID=UPI001B5E81F4|nr:hypothetical protein [Bathymodiolus japonicus methanotrophic gill symbiont]GFO72867.1 hypothetical protein BJAS_P3403 [Bathymodiolus japonicus methanotrophic gill symbiont]
MNYSIVLLRKEQECYSVSKKLFKELKKFKEKKDGLIINNEFLEPTDVLNQANAFLEAAELYHKAAEECRKAELLHQQSNHRLDRFKEHKYWNQVLHESKYEKKYTMEMIS